MRRRGSNFVFNNSSGTPNGLNVLRLTPRRVGVFDVAVTVKHADLSGADQEGVTITLQIGDDVATAAMVLRRVPQGFILP
jgi:hypothetical protein